MADLSQAITRITVGGSFLRLKAANQFAGKQPAPVSSGRPVKFPRAPGIRKQGPRR